MWAVGSLHPSRGRAAIGRWTSTVAAIAGGQCISVCWTAATGTGRTGFGNAQVSRGNGRRAASHSATARS